MYIKLPNQYQFTSKCIIIYQKVLKMGFFDISDEKYCNMGVNQFNKRNYSKALKYFEDALKKNPHNVNAWNGKGSAIFNMSNWGDSLECFDKALEINPTHPMALLNKATMLFRRSQFNESLKFYNKYLEINPNHRTSLLNKANILTRITRFTEAIDCLNKIQQINESIKEDYSSKNEYFNLLNRILNDKGIALSGLREYDESMNMLDKALEIIPGDARALNNKKITQIEKKLFESGDFIYIDKFAKKHDDVFRYGVVGYRYAEEYYTSKYNYIWIRGGIGDGNIEIELQRFQDLLKSKGYIINQELLMALLKNSIEIQSYNSFKEKILFNSPRTIEEYVDNYIDIFGESNEYHTEIQYLKKLIKEQGYPFVEISIDDMINNRKKGLELRNFERSLLDDDESMSINEIDELSGYEFEIFTKILFENMGYKSYHTKLSGDQGADLVLKKSGEITVVQAKRYSNKVTNSAIQEVVASIKYYNAHKGAVITNNGFTDSAFDLAYANGIELIDRNKLSELITKHPVNRTDLEKNI